MKEINLQEMTMEELIDLLCKIVQEIKNRQASTTQKQTDKKLKLNWAGALKEYCDKYTPLELQKKLWNGEAINLCR